MTPNFYIFEENRPYMSTMKAKLSTEIAAPANDYLGSRGTLKSRHLQFAYYDVSHDVSQYRKLVSIAL